MECEFCKKEFSTKPNLIYHQKNTKYCLDLQGKKNIQFKCEYCDKIFTCQQRLNEHILKVCKLKNKINFEKEIKKIQEDFSLYKKQEKLRLKDKEKQFEQKINEKNEYILKLEAKIEKFENTIANIANVPKTVNNIRNQLSTNYTLENLEPKKLEETLREYYTERDFFNGQKGLANCCVEKIVKTPDGKMLICCSDISRKKFKILDVNGNMREDIEARLLCQKLKVPIQAITKEIYDKVIDRINTECNRLSHDDSSKREKLLDDTMRAQQVFIDNMNFDDLNYNQDFMHELCILLNV
jgi:hypothetical protein